MGWFPLCSHARRLSVSAFVFISIVITDTAYSQAPPPQPCERSVLTLAEAAELLRIDAGEITRLAERNELPARRVGEAWRFNCDALMAWLKGDGKPGNGGIGQPVPDLSGIRATGTATSQAPTTSVPAAQQDNPVGEAPTELAAEDVFLRGQRVLLGRGQVVMDVGAFYSRSDDQVLASVEDAVGLSTVEQQTFSTIVLGRVGIFNETELSVSTTFSSQHAHQFLGSARLTSSARSEFGGMNVGLRRTLLREGRGRPDIIASIDGHIPTRDTQSAIAGGLIFVKSVDPVVLFANVNYLHAFQRDTANGTRLSGGNRADVSLGYGLGLNDTLALSMAVSGVFNATTAINDSRVRQANSFSARFGLT